MVYISKEVKYVIRIFKNYIIIASLCRWSQYILLNYYDLDDSTIEKLKLTEKEKKLLSERKAKVAEQAKLNSADHSNVRGRDGALLVKEPRGIIDRYIIDPMDKLIDRYFKRPFSDFIIKILETLGIRSVVEQILGAVIAAVLSMDRFALGLGVAISQASPYCNVRPPEELMAYLERELNKEILSIEVLDCNSRFIYAEDHIKPTISEETTKYIIGRIKCDEGLLISSVDYIRCIALIGHLQEIGGYQAIIMLLARIVELVKSGRMSKYIAWLIFKIIIQRYGIQPPDYELPKLPKLPKLPGD